MALLLPIAACVYYSMFEVYFGPSRAHGVLFLPLATSAPPLHNLSTVEHEDISGSGLLGTSSFHNPVTTIPPCQSMVCGIDTV